MQRFAFAAFLVGILAATAAAQRPNSLAAIAPFPALGLSPNGALGDVSALEPNAMSPTGAACAVVPGKPWGGCASSCCLNGRCAACDKCQAGNPRRCEWCIRAKRQVSSGGCLQLGAKCSVPRGHWPSSNASFCLSSCCRGGVCTYSDQCAALGTCDRLRRHKLPVDPQGRCAPKAPAPAPPPPPPPSPPPPPAPSPDRYQCKSGTYYFTGETVSFNGAVNDKTEWVVSFNGRGDNVFLTPEGLQMKLQRSRERQADGRFRGLAAVISSVRKFAHGRVTARMRIGPNQAPGVVSAFITMSQLGDEIDFEWLAGKEPNQVSVNWFSRAIADYGRDTKCWINADPRYTFHDYSIEWTADKITWTVDGAYCKDIRKWDYPRGPEYPSGYLFPEEEPLVQFGIWDGGAGAAGTRDWAGGYIPWETAEGERGYEMTVQSVTIQCY